MKFINKIVDFFDKRHSYESQKKLIKNIIGSYLITYAILIIIIMSVIGWKKYNPTGFITVISIYLIIFTPIFISLYRSNKKFKRIKEKINKKSQILLKYKYDDFLFNKGEIFELKHLNGHKVYFTISMNINSILKLPNKKWAGYFYIEDRIGNSHDLIDYINKLEIVDDIKDVRAKKLKRLKNKTKIKFLTML